VSGVALYGFLGWLADRWLGTTLLVALGIVVGAALGMYMTFSRFNKTRPSGPQPGSSPSTIAPADAAPPQQDPVQD